MTTIHLHDYVEQVDKLIDDNRLVEAIEHCRHILHSYPRHIDTYRVMGKALLEKQDFDAASDLFLRILSADPNDFISHVGLSIVYKEESQLDQALWHLERAHEIQPYNVAIQGELRKLYNTQTEVRAGIIPLSRGALARLYMQGELYQQAISELRRILIDEPERVDLQVLLAEALWRDDQRIDAEEVCLTVLQELPNCVVANAILAEIWLQTGRIPEAQKYLHRLHRLTQQTQKTLDKETIAGQAFTTEGAFPLPEEASLEFLQTGMVEPSKPQAPTDDWVKEVKFDEPAGEESLDQVVLEPESGMHSYDWLSDIGDAEGDGAEKATGETDWFSQEKAKDELKISTSELNAEWLADLRGEEEESGFQPLDLGDTTNQLVTDEQPSETDWFADDGEGAGETAVAEEFDFAETAVSPTEQSPSEETEEDELNWLDALADEETSLQIDATNLMDNDMATWADSEPHVVEEPKTPYWLSSMTKDELEAIELDPDEAMDWLDDIPDEADVEEATADSEPGEEVDLVDLMETAVAPQDLPTDDDLASVALDTGDLGEADDWLSALTEGEIDEELAWETGEADSEAIDPI
ncbi:MAG: tetratricopeptide repeat protein, partial [Anaerolineales bacterium]|nr:tetratricopeptide repeat protein [Anaerolineales bacterium]